MPLPFRIEGAERMKICKGLKGYCLRNEWASGLFGFVGVALLLGSAWVLAEYHAMIQVWVGSNILAHGLLFGLAVLVNVLLIYGFLCLGFSECSAEDKNCIHAYRGRRSRHPETIMRFLESVGKNPRRFPRGS